MRDHPVRPPDVLLTSRGILDTFWLNLKGGLLGGGIGWEKYWGGVASYHATGKQPLFIS